MKLFHSNWPKPEERKERDGQQEENKMAAPKTEGIPVEAQESTAEKLVISLKSEVDHLKKMMEDRDKMMEAKDKMMEKQEKMIEKQEKKLEK